MLVLRTESLWSDFTTLDQQLGGSGILPSNVTKRHTTHGSEQYAVRGGLDQPNGSDPVRALCCVLWDEILWYRRLLRRAANLPTQDIVAALVLVQDQCGMVGDYDDDGKWETWP